eukprot:3773855-Pleurochrysis_carterae.AAC.1
MDEKARKRATAYMESIGCYLDLRAKGQRNPENKFMTGATVDDYVMGRLRDPKSRSPGLAANTLALCELTYGGGRTKPSATTNSVPPPAAAAPAKKTLGTRRQPAAPLAGFLAGAAMDEVVAADGSAKPE